MSRITRLVFDPAAGIFPVREKSGESNVAVFHAAGGEAQRVASCLRQVPAGEVGDGVGVAGGKVLAESGGKGGKRYPLRRAEGEKGVFGHRHRRREALAAGEQLLWKAYDSLRCPTLLVRGSQSDLLTAETAAEMTARGPKARLVEFEGVGHAPTFVPPGQIEVVREFLLGP